MFSEGNLGQMVASRASCVALRVFTIDEGKGGDGMDIRVLGPIEIDIDGRAVRIPTHQAARVLTLLAAWPGQVLEADRIMVALWGHGIKAGTRNTLQAHISQLRKVLGSDRIASESGGYRLVAEPTEVDAHLIYGRMRRAAMAFRDGRFGWARHEYGRVLETFRGQPFAGIDDAEVRARTHELLEIRALCQEEHLACGIELALDAVELGEQIAHARNLVHQHPERERRRALLVRALAAADRKGEATAAFHDGQVFLRDSVGLDPGAGLMEVFQQTLCGDPALVPAIRSRMCTGATASRLTVPHPVAARAVAVVRDQFLTQAPVRVWVQVCDEDVVLVMHGIVSELLGDFRIGVHVHSAQDGPFDNDACRSSESLLILIGPDITETYVDQSTQALTAPSLLAVTALDPPTQDNIIRIAGGDKSADARPSNRLLTVHHAEGVENATHLKFDQREGVTQASGNRVI